MSNKVLRYEFGNYHLLPSERLLYRAGEKIPLKSKVFETLLTLVRNQGQLLTKDELMLQIWGNNFVEEANLTQNIFTLRKIFGEKPRDHQFIVTVPGRGYRFVAPVETVSGQKTENQANGSIPTSLNGHTISLAVLPLKFLIPKDAESEKYLGLAIADSLITQLSACRKFSVRSTETVLRYAETEKDAISIGRELNVEVVLSGTIQTLNAKIRANLQLYETKTGDTLWADKFEVVSTDFFEMQDSISSQAADALVRQGHSNLKARKAAPDNPDIYQKYIKYRFFWESRTEEGLLASLANAKEIVASAPDFALGYVCLADAYLLLGHHLYLPPEKVYRNVERAVEKALELEPDSAEAHATKADLCFINRGWETCEKYHRKAISIKPDYASAHHWYSWFLTAVGRFDESLQRIEEAQRLDPNSLYLTTICGVPSCYKGDFEQGIKQFRLVLEMDPGFKRARYYLAWALFHSGRHAEGIEEYERVVADEPIQQTFAFLGYSYGRTGMKEKAYDEKSIWLIWLKVDLQFKVLHDEPRFQDLLKKLNFPK